MVLLRYFCWLVVIPCFADISKDVYIAVYVRVDCGIITSKQHTKIYARISDAQKFTYYANLVALDPSLTL